jgi:hypothetical protein
MPGCSIHFSQGWAIAHPHYHRPDVLNIWAIAIETLQLHPVVG